MKHSVKHGSVGGARNRQCMTPTWLFSTYIAAAVIEVAGICLTVGTYIEFKAGFGTVHQPKNKFQALRGPVLIAGGVIVGLIANAATVWPLL